MPALASVIKRPAAALTRHNNLRRQVDEEVGESTVTVPATTHTNSLRRRKHDIMKAPSSSSKDHKIVPFESPSGLESVKSPQARHFFETLCIDTPFVLITMGPADMSRVIQVRLQEHDDDEQVLRKMRTAWSQMSWLKRLRNVRRVEEVKIRFAGWKEFRNKRMLTALCKPIDLSKTRRNLEERLAAAENTAKDVYRIDADSDWCYRIISTGKYDHILTCPSLDFGHDDCPMRQYDELCAHLQRLDQVPILTQAFCSPELARGQHLLDGLAENWGQGYYSTSSILRIVYGCDSIGNIVFTGYNIIDDWHPLLYRALLPVGGTIVVALCFLFRVIFGDWQTAFAAASVILAVMAVAIQWMIFFGQDI